METQIAPNSSSINETSSIEPLMKDVCHIVPHLPACVYTYVIDNETGESSFPYASNYFEKIFGIPASDIMNDGEMFVNLVHPDDVNVFTASVLDSMTNMTNWDLRFRMLNKQGQTVFIHGMSAPSSQRRTNADGSVTQLTLWHGVLFDITSREGDEKSDPTDCTPSECKAQKQPTFLLDKKGNVVEWDEYMSKLVGFEQSEVLGKPLNSLLAKTSDPLHLPSAEDFESSMSSQDNTFCQDMTLGSKDGRSLRVYVTYQQQKDSSNAGIGIKCSCKDVTPLRETESGKQLALESYEEAKKMTEWMSHEIRNPLSAAMESSYSLRDMIRASISPSSNIANQEQISSFSDLICSSIAYVVSLLTNMLDLNKAMESKIIMRPTVCSLNEDIIKPCQEMMGIWGTKVPISFSGKDIVINIDKLRLKQVIINLLSNAIKRTSEGFIRISTHEVNKDVDGSLIEDSLEIRVSDSGELIKDKDFLFAKWNQLESKANNDGIGLYLSRVLVDAMGGQIFFNKSYHSGMRHPGSQFVIRLSMNSILAQRHGGIAMHSVSAFNAVSSAVLAKNSYALKVEEKLKKSSLQGSMSKDLYVYGKFNILIVDDDEIVRKLFQRRFSRLFPQAVIDQAESGEKAIELSLKKEKFYDIIFMDQFMSVNGLTGDETIKKLREEHIDSFIAGISGNCKAQEHIRAGAQAFFRKPLPSNQVILSRMLPSLPPPFGWKVLIVDATGVNGGLLKRKMHVMSSCHFTSQEIAEKRWEIVVSTNFNDALKLLETYSFECLVLDSEVSEPEWEGVDVASVAKKKSCNQDIFIVSTSGSGLEEEREGSGCVDIYWQKPYPSVEEMRHDLAHLMIQMPVSKRRKLKTTNAVAKS